MYKTCLMHTPSKTLQSDIQPMSLKALAALASGVQQAYIFQRFSPVARQRRAWVVNFPQRNTIQPKEVLQMGPTCETSSKSAKLFRLRARLQQNKHTQIGTEWQHCQHSASSCGNDKQRAHSKMNRFAKQTEAIRLKAYNESDELSLSAMLESLSLIYTTTHSKLELSLGQTVDSTPVNHILFRLSYSRPVSLTQLSGLYTKGNKCKQKWPL